MTETDTEFPLPDDLPEPEDDCAADHLPGTTLPSVPLSATDGSTFDLAALDGRTVVYCYPMTGRPDEDVIPEGWDAIPGARGCTPESCAFRDHYEDLRGAGADAVFGLSVRTTAYQREARDRLGLPYELLSEHGFALAEALDLPTFEAAGDRYLKRLTLVVEDGVVDHVFYPVFPPDDHAGEVLAWLEADE
jgi:peroxiredoxin